MTAAGRLFTIAAAAAWIGLSVWTLLALYRAEDTVQPLPPGATLVAIVGVMSWALECGNRLIKAVRSLCSGLPEMPA
jgi:hypothetical protein